MIPEAKIVEVQQAADIVQTINKYIPLKNSGVNLKACCPFHSEKTPSFMVSPDKQIFKCFGCGKGGNVFSFIMEYEKMTFVEAVKTVAEEYGISVSEYSQGNERYKDKINLFSIMKWGMNYFHKELLSTNEGQKAKEYIIKRGFKLSTISKFHLGYCPQSTGKFIANAKKEGISVESLLQAGLMKKSMNGDFYLPFRNRLIFPIFNAQGKTIAFGARSMDGRDPKYINTHETPLFSKRNTLYALNFSKRQISDNNCAIVFEGYTDVLMSFQNGLENTVATLGTSLTPQHVKLLNRYVDKVIVVYDGDSAGQKAAERSLDLFIKEDVDIRVAILPENMDPCDILGKKDGKEKFLKTIENAHPILDYKLIMLKKRFDINTIYGQTSIIDELLKIVKDSPNPVHRALQIKYISSKLDINETILMQRMNTMINYTRNFNDKNKEEDEIKKYNTVKYKTYFNIIYILSQDTSLIDKTLKELKDIGVDDIQILTTIEKIKELDKNYKTVNEGLLLSFVENKIFASALAGVFEESAKKTGDKERALTDSIIFLRKEKIKEKERKLFAMLKEADKNGNKEIMNKILGEISKCQMKVK